MERCPVRRHRRNPRTAPGDGDIPPGRLSWINALIGAWLIVAAFTIDHSTTGSRNDLIVGAIVLGLALSSGKATANPFPPRRRMPPLTR
jgi:hypothetical protein